MHWFWRGVIALGIGSLLATAIRGEFYRTLAVLMPQGIRPGSQALQAMLRFFDVFVVRIGTVVLATAATYMLLSRFIVSQAADRQTRCRNCHYILRGITEPRCPECGERI